MLNFFKDIKQWIDGGFAHSDSFVTNVGLCSNLIQYAINYYPHYTAVLENELENLFRNSGYCEPAYPFNENSKDYVRECENGGVYKNKARLEFIDNQIKILSEKIL